MTIEEQLLAGGFGSAVAEVLVDSGARTRCRRLGLDDRFCLAGGTRAQYRKALGVDAESIVRSALELLGA